LFGDLLTPGAGGNAGLIGNLFSGIGKHADGGIIHGRQISWLGENGPEAVIPLKGGAVPVQMNGRGDGDGKVYIVVDSAEAAFAKGFNRHRDTMINLVAREMGVGGKLRKIANR
jgi:hypothetical protein